jgi:hypothetical protein
MLLRWLVLILLLVNALFFGWTRDWLDDFVGVKAHGDREPERMARQSHPEMITLLKPQDLPALQAKTCVEFGPVDSEALLLAAQAALLHAGIAAGEMQAQHQNLPGVWAVVTGPLAPEMLARKEETFRRLNLGFEALPAGELKSLLLSRHDSEKVAAAALDAFEKRALKGLRVSSLQPPLKRHSLVLAQVEAGQAQGLRGLKDEALRAGFKTCAVAPAASAASVASVAR